jgi:hypothetical protein
MNRINLMSRSNKDDTINQDPSKESAKVEIRVNNDSIDYTNDE